MLAPKSKRALVLDTLRSADCPMPTRTVSAASRLALDDTLGALKALEAKGIAKRVPLPRDTNRKASRFAWEYAR